MCACGAVTAMYLVFNAIENSSTDAEKAYALLAELVVGLIFGALAATITNGWIPFRWLLALLRVCHCIVLDSSP